MSDSHAKRFFLLAVLVLAVLAGAWYLAAKPAPPRAAPAAAPPPSVAARPVAPGAATSTQPKITWSSTSTRVLLAPGESMSQDFTFVSDQNLENAALEAVPGISGFLTIQPNTFANVLMGQPQSVHVSFSIASGTALGSYAGTIHLTLGSTTLPQTLKVSIMVGTRFTDSALDLTFVIPPIGAPPQTQVNKRSGGVTQVVISTMNSTDQQPVPQFEVTLYPNPTLASLHDWFEQNVDVGGVLLSGNAFTVQQLANGPALVRTAPVPAQYEGGPVDDAYILSPANDAVVSIAESQVNDMLSQGSSQQQITALLISTLGTVETF